MPPEILIINAISILSQKEKKILNLNLKNLTNNHYSLHELIDFLFRTLKIPEIQFFAQIFKKIFDLDATHSHQLLDEMLNLIKYHLDLSNDLEISYKSISLRINLIQVVLGFILGSLVPIFFQFSSIFSQLDTLTLLSNFQIANQSIYLYFLICAIFLTISIYYLNRINFSSYKLLIALFSGISYIISFFISNNFIRFI